MDILLGGADVPPRLLLKYANRHGLIAGATGTGKTVSLQVLSEGFSGAGVPVFVADIKGDLAGISQPGKPHPKIQERVDSIGLDFAFEGTPVTLWDLFGEKGHPIRTTVSEMGPLLLSRLLELNDTQEGVLNIAFRVADEQGLLLLDLKDLRSMLVHVAEQASTLSAVYGNVSKASVAAIQRRLLVLEEQGASEFFGEPAFDIHDLMRFDGDLGMVNVLAADRLMESPRLYAMFLLWLLSELFEELPEVGDVDRPKLVFVFDEAHLLFDGAPKSLIQKVTQVVKLVRSKGIGVYFVTQSPSDIPEPVLAQLGNRIQHALRAYTPREQRAVRVAAQSFRPNPAFDTAEAIGQLGVGEALVSVLEAKGRPTVVQQTLMCPPRSRMGTITQAERKAILQSSRMAGRYDAVRDRESAYEMLAKRAQTAREAKPTRPSRRAARKARPSRRRQSVGEAFVKSTARSVGSQLGRRVIRGLMGSILK